jgi:hypothetical protein
MATTTSTTQVGYCQGCGAEPVRLYGDEHCQICHLYHLSGDEEASCTALRMIAQMVEDAVIHEGVHPDDIRETVLDRLTSPKVTERAGRTTRRRELSDALREHKRLLLAEAVA